MKQEEIDLRREIGDLTEHLHNYIDMLTPKGIKKLSKAIRKDAILIEKIQT